MECYIGMFKPNNKERTYDADLEQLGVPQNEMAIFYARTFENIKALRLAVQFHNKKFPHSKVQISKIVVVYL